MFTAVYRIGMLTAMAAGVAALIAAGPWWHGGVGATFLYGMSAGFGLVFCSCAIAMPYIAYKASIQKS
jgi:hypothetical protein